MIVKKPNKDLQNPYFYYPNKFVKPMTINSAFASPHQAKTHRPDESSPIIFPNHDDISSFSPKSSILNHSKPAIQFLKKIDSDYTQIGPIENEKSPHNVSSSFQNIVKSKKNSFTKGISSTNYGYNGVNNSKKAKIIPKSKSISI